MGDPTGAPSDFQPQTQLDRQSAKFISKGNTKNVASNFEKSQPNITIINDDEANLSDVLNESNRREIKDSKNNQGEDISENVNHQSMLVKFFSYLSPKKNVKIQQHDSQDIDKYWGYNGGKETENPRSSVGSLESFFQPRQSARSIDYRKTTRMEPRKAVGTGRTPAQSRAVNNEILANAAKRAALLEKPAADASSKDAAPRDIASSQSRPTLMRTLFTNCASIFDNVVESKQWRFYGLLPFGFASDVVTDIAYNVPSALLRKLECPVSRNQEAANSMRDIFPDCARVVDRFGGAKGRECAYAYPAGLLAISGALVSDVVSATYRIPKALLSLF